MIDVQSMAHYHYRDYQCQHQRDYAVYHNCDMKTLAERLTASRHAAKLSQSELAKRAGIKNQSTIGMLESGERKTTSYVPALASVLNVPALWLATGTGSNPLETTEDVTSTIYAMAEKSAPLEQISIEAQAKAIADQASEVGALWLSLPRERRTKILIALREEVISHTQAAPPVTDPDPKNPHNQGGQKDDHSELSDKYNASLRRYVKKNPPAGKTGGGR